MAVATSCLEGLFTSGNHNKATVRFQNNKLKLVLKLPRVSAILPQIQNGNFVYISNQNKLKLR